MANKTVTMRKLLAILACATLMACSGGGENGENDGDAAGEWQASFDALMTEHQDFMGAYNAKLDELEEWAGKNESKADSTFMLMEEAHTSTLEKHEDWIEEYAFNIKDHQDLKAAFDAGELTDEELKADIGTIDGHTQGIKDAREGMIQTIEAMITEHMQSASSNEDDGFEDDL